MSNSSSPGPYCKLLDSMLDHILYINPGVNLGMVILHGLVSCLGILENALVLWVLGVRLRRTTVSFVWVLNLAASDFLATLTLPLFTHYFSQSHSWELGGPLCSAQAFVFYLNMFVSAFLLAAISLDRCLLVARPVWSHNHRSVGGAWKVCGVGWLWAAANAFPYFLFREVTETHDKSRRLCYHNFALYASPGAVETDCMVRQAATAVSKTLLAFLLPLVVIAGSYGLFCVSLRKRRTRRKENAERLASTWILNEGGGGGGASIAKMSSIFKPSSRQPNYSTTPVSPVSPVQGGGEAGLSRGFTKMVTAVIAAFVLCWAPYHAFCLVEIVAQFWYPGVVNVVEVGLPLATTFAFLNPILNPVLYAFSCPQFCVRVRQGLSALVEGLVEEEGEGGGRRLSLKPLERRKGGGGRLVQPPPPPPIPLLSPSPPSLPSPSSHSSHSSPRPSLYIRSEGGEEETEETSGEH